MKSNQRKFLSEHTCRFHVSLKVNHYSCILHVQKGVYSVNLAEDEAIHDITTFMCFIYYC